MGAVHVLNVLWGDAMAQEAEERAAGAMGSPEDGPLSGLTASEVAERIEQGRVNVNMELKTKSVRELIADNLFTLFNLINLFSQSL